MIIGRFGGTSQRPHIEARLAIPSLKLSGEISLILDTGADSTVLMPMDAVKLGVDYGALKVPTQSTGIGGVSHGFREQGVLTFRGSGGALYTYQISLILPAPTSQIMAIPSLLGRDILNRWGVNCDPTNSILECAVRSCDLEIAAGSKLAALKQKKKLGKK